MELIIDDRVINEDPFKMLEDLRRASGKPRFFKLSGSGIAVTCPVHANGDERHPSCYINISSDSAAYLWVHCFTCDLNVSFPKFVGLCFDRGESFGKKWLLSNYISEEVGSNLTLEPIKLNNDSEQTYLDESILSQFESYHPYMKKRKLTDEVIKKFDIKYDPQTKCIVFPVRDKWGKLVGLTRRSVIDKRFIIDKGFDKKNIYCLDKVLKERTVYVVESQINALTLWSWNYPSIATFGAGCPDEQINELNKSGIRHFVICFDPDQAGVKGANKLKKMLSKDKFVDVVTMPVGKDVNDLTKEEFEQCLKNAKI